MDNNYFFIDGSALLSEINKYKKTHKLLKDKKFDPVAFSKFFFNPYGRFRGFHGGTYRRTVFYFVKNDQRIDELLKVPDFSRPGVIEDLEIKYCGKKISTHEKAKKWLDANKAPNSVLDSLYKSEKAVDTQICCDALVLLALNKLDRLFLYSNDYDFIPLCKAIKTMGSNINLVKLTETKVNSALVKECDSFCAFSDQEIHQFFGVKI